MYVTQVLHIFSTIQGTPLKIACEHGYLPIVDMLLCNKAPLPDPVPESCDCPFFTVTYNGWVDILDVLLKYKSGKLEQDCERINTHSL